MDDGLDVPPAPDPPQQRTHSTGTNRFLTRSARPPSKPPPVARSATLSSSSVHGNALMGAYALRFEEAASEFSMNHAPTMGARNHRVKHDRNKHVCSESHRFMYLTGGCAFSTVFCAFALLPLCRWETGNAYQRQNRSFYCVGVAVGLMIFSAVCSIVIVLFLGVYRDELTSS